MRRFFSALFGSRIVRWVGVAIVAIALFLGGFFLWGGTAEPAVTADEPADATATVTTGSGGISASASVSAAEKAEGDTAIRAMASVEGTVDAIKNGASLENKISISSKIRDKSEPRTVSAEISEEISLVGGDQSRYRGQAEVIQAQAKLAEVQLKYAPKPAPAPVAIEPIRVSVDVSGTVGHTGTVAHEGTVAHSGTVAHEGTVAHSGSVKVTGTVDGKVTGVVTVNTGGKTVTRRVCWNGRHWVYIN